MGSIKENNFGLLPLGDILKQAIPAPVRVEIEAAEKTLKPLSRVQNRLLEPCPEHELEICFQHSVLCQTGLPYRKHDDDVRRWQRTQGTAMLVINAGEILEPQTGTSQEARLPWGPKPRLILAHLNAEALRLGSPEVTMEDSLSAFVKRIRGFDSGREIKVFKEQLQCLCAAEVRLA